MIRFDYEIFRTPGKDMYLADTLSRPLGEGCPDEAILNSIRVEKFVDQSINNELKKQKKTELLESLGMTQFQPSAFNTLGIADQRVGVHCLGSYDGFIVAVTC